MVLQVHTAFSKVGLVEGGPLGLIAALQAAVGRGGTLVMPSMSDDDDHPFDARTTPCIGMGVVADTFRRLPEVLRSDSPHAFAASGPLASRIVAPHPLSLPHGPDSPVGRVHELGGHVLLLGVGHTADTTVHLAEYLAGVRYRRRKRLTVLRDGVPSPYEYDEIDHCCERFALVDGWLDGAGRQRREALSAGVRRASRRRRRSWTSWSPGSAPTRRRSCIPRARTISATRRGRASAGCCVRGSGARGARGTAGVRGSRTHLSAHRGHDGFEDRKGHRAPFTPRGAGGA